MDRRDLLRALCTVPIVGWADEARADDGDSEELSVIVHPKIRARLNEAELRSIFLTRRVDFPGGGRAIPFNFPARHRVRVAFDRAVLHMGPDEVARYWIDRRIRGGNRPPKQVPSANLMVRVIQRLEGAIGYVSADTNTSGVRVIGHVSAGRIELIES